MAIEDHILAEMDAWWTSLDDAYRERWLEEYENSLDLSDPLAQTLEQRRLNLTAGQGGWLRSHIGEHGDIRWTPHSDFGEFLQAMANYETIRGDHPEQRT